MGIGLQHMSGWLVGICNTVTTGNDDNVTINCTFHVMFVSEQ